MKKAFLSSAMLLVFATASQAATVTTSLTFAPAFGANGIVTSASLVDQTVTVGGTQFEYDLVFTGLVGDGTAGGTTSGIRIGNGTNSFLMSINGNTFTATRQVDFAVANVSVLSGTLDASDLNFDGLSAITVSNVNQTSKNVIAGSTTVAGITADGSYNVGGLPTSVTSTGTINSRFDAATLQFTAVPEPSTAVLVFVSLFGFGCVMYRRRRS